MQPTSRIYVAGHRGMVGSAIVRRLQKEGFENIIVRSSSELDLRDSTAVEIFFREEKPEYVFLAAAKVGGIVANNTYRAEFLYDNLMIQNNVIHQSYKSGVKKLLFLGSSCIYPKMAPQPLKEEYLLTGLLEPTNEPYAIAKITGIKMCDAYRAQYGCNFISAMPCNLYGPNDNYNLQNSHVIPALIRKFHEAKVNGNSSVTVWGSGEPLREFMHVDDLADASLFLMKQFNKPGFINVGTGFEISIRELAEMIAGIAEFGGELQFDAARPDGARRKLMDVSRLSLIGWRHSIELNAGLFQVYKDWLQQCINK
ncbi:MAG: GDP-L-fucose synthase [Cyclobacteriaceae bacterium]|nr:GDP-L-fucose synthase [Cyclobacteriaceae bacterium]